MTNTLNDRLDDMFGPSPEQLSELHGTDLDAEIASDQEHCDEISHLLNCQDDEKLAAMETRLLPAHVEPCPKCRGSGVWRGNYRTAHCFACKGTGRLTFKNSAEQRAKARAAGARRKEERAARDAARAADEALAWAEEHKTEHAWICANMAGFDFARSMHEALHRWGGLTEGQLAAVQRCVARDTERAERRAAERAARPAAPKLDVSRIEAAFAEARVRAERRNQMGTFVKPLRLTSSEATGKLSVRFFPGTPGTQWEGKLFAKTEGGKKLGHFERGAWVPKYECTEAERAAVFEVAGDPERAVMAYAKAWSRCGICGRGLLNDVSIERGIGPICAGRFGFFGS